MGIKLQYDKEVKEVLTDQPPTHELLVKWKGLLESLLGVHPTLMEFKTQIQAHEDKKVRRTSPK